MFDLKEIRDNPEKFDKGWARRGLTPQTGPILALDEKRRAAQTEMQTLQQQRNEASKAIGQVKAKGGDAAAEMAKVAEIKTRIQTLETEEAEIGQKLDALLSGLPNIPDDSVPDGKDETGNKEVRKSGSPSRRNDVKDHVDIGETLGLMDFETAAKMSGARFVLLRDGLARLERALAQFMLDTHAREFGYMEMSVPLLVRDNAMFGTAQLPKFAEDQFLTTAGLWLIPTAEVSLTNTVADMILTEDELPLRFTAMSPCFRSEAGAAGKDTRGMIRQHQFWKVELVSVTNEESSMQELERMTSAAETVLKKLDLPFRTMALCAGDMGFASRKTYDIEVWLPAQNAYREISSCSNCGDFQARRMKARYRKEGEKQTRFVHTLNGSGVAVGRALVAVLENYQQADGSVAIPDVLKSYMGGIEKLEPPASARTGKKAHA